MRIPRADSRLRSSEHACSLRTASLQLTPDFRKQLKDHELEDLTLTSSRYCNSFYYLLHSWRKPLPANKQKNLVTFLFCFRVSRWINYTSLSWPSESTVSLNRPVAYCVTDERFKSSWRDCDTSSVNSMSGSSKVVIYAKDPHVSLMMTWEF